jgi:predicted ATPase/DNA-binding NarL/FixJ family response regulator
MTQRDEDAGLAESTASEDRSQATVPVALTPLIGRADELGLLVERLRAPDCRLVTISGAGGVGKTRLALEAAALVANPPSPFVHGTFFVSLAALTPGEPIDDALATTIASALELTLSGPDPAPLQLRNFLRAKAALIALDNFDHLLAASPFVAALLEAAPAVTILITSRERLRLRGEWVVDLDGLATPPPDAELSVASVGEYDALRLFVERMRALAPDVPLDKASVQAIGRICRLVDGLPLGVELAASWARFFSCAEIARELDLSLDFLSDDSPDLPERQRSLRAVFDSSWRMLTAPEQEALRRLAVFRGSFTREAAAAVAGASLPLLVSLLNKSLIRRPPSGHAETRYTLAEPVRQFAASQLSAAGEADESYTRHAAFYLGLLATRSANLDGPAQPAALAELGAEVDQIRSAWRWAVARRDHTRLAAAADGFFDLCNMRSWFAEGAEAFGSASRALAPYADGAARDTWGKLLGREGWFAFLRGHPADARALLEQSLTVARSSATPADLAWTLSYLSAVCSYQGDYAAAETFGREGLAIAEGGRSAKGQVMALSVLCQNAYERGDFTGAARWGERSLALEQQLGSPWSMAFSLTNLGRVVAARGDHQRAHRLFAESLQIRRDLGDLRGAAICLNRMGASEAAQGRSGEAAERYRESLALFRQIGSQWGVAATLLHLGALAKERGATPAAIRLFREALQLALATKTGPQIREASVALTTLAAKAQAPWAAAQARSSADPGPADLDRMLGWAARTSLTLDQALAAAYAAAGDPAPAQQPAAAAAPAAARPAARGSRNYPAGLTAREVEVLQLVAEGLTDQEVAERLVLSRRTVHAHLSSIYGKLSVANRSAATRFAVEHGLV